MSSRCYGVGVDIFVILAKIKILMIEMQGKSDFVAFSLQLKILCALDKGLLIP